MKKGYWIVAYRSVSDEATLREYAKLADPVVAAHGGRLLISTSDVKTAEAGLEQRTTVIEFDSLQQAIATHDSDEYQRAAKVLGSAAERDFRIVEGFNEIT
jgi:uncharacterized protein (DUF1330 family)